MNAKDAETKNSPVAKGRDTKLPRRIPF